MEVFKRVVCVGDTDLTRSLYFTSLLRFVQEGFEALLRKKYLGVGKLFLEQKIAMPIVSTSANFLLPIHAGDQIEIHLDVAFGKSSFTVKGVVTHEGKEKGYVMIKHVCLDLQTRKRISSKDLFHDLLVF